MTKRIDASVLSFEKKLVPSDGYMYGTNWDTKSEKKPLEIMQKAVRGVIGNRPNKKDEEAYKKDPLKLDAAIENPNLQTVDSCSLNEDQDTLCLNFTLKVLGGIEKPFASNGQELNKSYPLIVKKYIEETGFTELAKRYATNIANARFLWRNRVGAEKIEVLVKIGSDEPLVFDAKKFSINQFDSSDSNLQILANKIAEALSGKTKYLLLDISAYALVGKAQEVYPSEELVLDKGSSNKKGEKSKILYHVKQIGDVRFAGMHSQKIGNALRTIDTWYEEFSENNYNPIPIEAYGAVTNLGKAFRHPTRYKNAKLDFYTLFDRFFTDGDLENINEKHYVMAVLVRGGVFGVNKDDIKKNNKSKSKNSSEE